MLFRCASGAGLRLGGHGGRVTREDGRLVDRTVRRCHRTPVILMWYHAIAVGHVAPQWPVEGESRLRVLAPVDMVLHSATHLFCNEDVGNGLRDLVDLDSLLRDFALEPRFWPGLTARAAELDPADRASAGRLDRARRQLQRGGCDFPLATYRPSISEKWN